MIRIGDLDIHFVEKGEGEPILMLHGWGASVDSFDPLIKHLAKRHRVVALDLPGFGKSCKLDRGWTVSDYSQFVLRFIKELGLENCTLIGHSFGGRIIIKLVAQDGFMPKKIIFIDSAGIKPQRSIYYYLKVYSFKMIKNVLTCPLWEKYTTGLLQYARGKFGSADYKNADEHLRATMSLAINEDLTPYLRKIKAETLLIWGELDTATPLKDAKIFEREIAGSGLVVLEGAGHFSFLERLPQVLRVLDVFLP